MAKLYANHLTLYELTFYIGHVHKKSMRDNDADDDADDDVGDCNDYADSDDNDADADVGDCDYNDDADGDDNDADDDGDDGGWDDGVGAMLMTMMMMVVGRC